MTLYIVNDINDNDLLITNCVYTNSKSLNYIKIDSGEKIGIFKILEYKKNNTDKNLILLKEKKNNEIYLNNYQKSWLNIITGTKIETTLISSGIIETLKIITLSITNNNSLINPLIEITNNIIEEIKNNLIGIPLQENLKLIGYQNKLILIPINFNKIDSNKIISNDTEIKIISIDKTIKITEKNIKKELFNYNFNFLEMGIGGLDKQFEIIFRRAFSSRLIPEEIFKKIGINHIRGLMLYGPAGTGKTLIARQIGKILNCEEPKIVNGPSLLSSYYGKSEENVRELFADAKSDKSCKKLHLIILDEFDALGRKRGLSVSDSGTADKIVNQFLSMIDGSESLNNILLIGITNRLDLLDEALLRPGRFEVHIEIGLPDLNGRLDILKIHTNKMNQNGFLDQKINLKEIAEITKNFTGAEIESVIKNAVSYSISKNLLQDNFIKDNINPKISQIELIKSVNEIKPQFGSISKEIEIITSLPFELYSNEYSQIYSNILYKINNISKGNILSILLQGDSYVGKTTLACQIAKNSGYNCIKYINSETLINYNYKEIQIYDIFEQGYKSDSFVLILDSIEKIIEYSKLGNIYNNKILQTIYTILSKIVNSNKSIIIILTSSNRHLMLNLELNTICNYTYQLSDTSSNKTNNKMVSEYFKDNKFQKY
jgi:vesicle-fusing ATPase